MADWTGFGAAPGNLIGQAENVGFYVYSRPTVQTFTPSPAAVAASTGANPVETSYSLYGHTVPLSVFGVGRIGGEIISGPWIENGLASFIISFGVPADPSGTRDLREIAFDSEVVWDSVNGFHTESFTYRFYGGTLTQAADALETTHFGANAVAYRPQMLLAFSNLPLANTKFKKIPYVAAVIGDATGDDVNLGEAFERIAYSPWVGYTSSQFETSGITDGLVSGGLIFAQDSEFLATIQQFGRFYPTWDILQTDKLRIVDRGSTVTADIVLNKTRLMSQIQVTRQGPDTVKKDLELSTIDPDADYTIVPSVAQRPRDPVAVTASVGKDSAYLPAIMDSPTRTALVTFAKYHEEATRKTISGTAMAYGLQIEPGTLVAIRNLGDDFYNETFKVVETLHGANNTVEFTAASILKCSIDIPDAGGLLVSASDTRYDISTTMDQHIPACATGDMLIAAVMHRSALTTLAGWTLVGTATAVYTASGGGTHMLSLFCRVAQPGDSAATTTWTQASALRISVHIQAFRSTVRTLTVVDFASSNTNDTSATSIATAVATATGDGQIGVSFATTALASAFLPTGLLLTMVAGAHQTTDLPAIFTSDNRLCGGYALLNLGDDTAGLVESDQTLAAGGGWAAVSLVLG